MQTNLNLYSVFYETAKCNSISEAAKNLYISQPAVSKSISKLEMTFGTELFMRNSRGVRLTEAGDLLFKQLDNAFGLITYGEAQVQRLVKKPISKLHIGVSTTLCKYVLLPHLSNFTLSETDIHVSIHCHSTSQILDDLDKGNLDIGLVGENYNNSYSDNNIVFRPVLDVHDTFVTTKSYLSSLLLSEHANVREILAKGHLMLLDSNNISRQYIDRYIHLYDVEINQLIEVSTMDLLIDFAKMNLGIACVIREFVENELLSGELVEVRFPEDIPKRKVGFVYKPGLYPTSVLEHFISCYE